MPSPVRIAITDIRTVFAWSYDTLTPDAARLFRLLIRLGETRFALGHQQAAREAWKRAAEILDELDHRDADSARTRIQEF